MRKFILALTFLIGWSAASAQTAVINESGFFIKKKAITKATRPYEVEALLGKPDRIATLSNIIWTYDKLGIYIYFNPGDSMLKHITFDLVKKTYFFSPQATYKSGFTINKKWVGKGSTYEAVKKIPGLRFSDSPLAMKPAYAGSTKIFFGFDEAKKSLLTIGVALVFKDQ